MFHVEHSPVITSAEGDMAVPRVLRCQVLVVLRVARVGAPTASTSACGAAGFGLESPQPELSLVVSSLELMI